MYGVPDSCPARYTFLCKFWHFQMAVSCLLLGLFTPNLGFCKSRCALSDICGSIVANPIIYRLVPSPSRYEIRQCCLHLNSRKRSLFGKLSWLYISWKCRRVLVVFGIRRHPRCFQGLGLGRNSLFRFSWAIDLLGRTSCSLEWWGRRRGRG